MDAIDLRGVVLVDATSGQLVDLGAEPGPTLLLLIRHRY
jgi:hypothetical protein